jgi:hypothetical protein
VPFEWGRLVHATALLAGIAVGGELLLPTTGAAGLALRAAALAVLPLALAATGFIRPAEWAGLRSVLTPVTRRAS